MAERLGILGGGQLGRMLTVDAKRLGFNVTVLDPTPNSPARQMGADQIQGSFKDPERIQELAVVSDFLTIEIEHVDVDSLRALHLGEGAIINPNPGTIEIVQDKLVQKEFLWSNGIPIANFGVVVNSFDVEEVASEFGYPVVLKTRRGGYDGRGNRVIKSPEDIAGAMRDFEGESLYVEQIIPFERELAVVIARDMDGEVAQYPVVQTIHVNNICHTVLAPAPIDPEIEGEAQKIAQETLRNLWGAGVFAIEMFQTPDGQVLVNEIAPRVHNSGHFTIEACDTSQFEQHVRAVTGLPLGNPDMQVGAAVMVNILGNRKGEAKIRGLSNALRKEGVHVHLYGKSDTKPERKMGHIVAVADDLDTAKEKVEKARSFVTI